MIPFSVFFQPASRKHALLIPLCWEQTMGWQHAPDSENSIKTALSLWHRMKKHNGELSCWRNVPCVLSHLPSVTGDTVGVLNYAEVLKNVGIQRQMGKQGVKIGIMPMLLISCVRCMNKAGQSVIKGTKLDWSFVVFKWQWWALWFPQGIMGFALPFPVYPLFIFLARVYAQQRIQVPE